LSFLADTMLVSESMKPRPNAGVLAWLAGIDEDQVFVSVATLAEIRAGIEGLAQGVRRKQLDHWLREELAARFEGRILPVDAIVADAWGKMAARRKAAGRPMEAVDALIAATAEVHGLTLVTRNVSDFQGSVKSILNPWTTD